MYDIQNIYAQTVKVVVKDQNGNIIPSARVSVYGAKKGCFYCSTITVNPLLEEVSTNSVGEAIITGPSGIWEMSETPNTRWLAKIVKVSHSGLKGGAYINFLDIQKEKIMNNNDIFTLNIVIN